MSDTPKPGSEGRSEGVILDPFSKDPKERVGARAQSLLAQAEAEREQLQKDAERIAWKLGQQYGDEKKARESAEKARDEAEAERDEVSDEARIYRETRDEALARVHELETRLVAIRRHLDAEETPDIGVGLEHANDEINRAFDPESRSLDERTKGKTVGLDDLPTERKGDRGK